MWPERLKINKQLATAMAEAQYNTPKEIQEKSMTKIGGGQDIIGIGPEGCGKTSTYVLSLIMKLKYAHEEAPRALVLVPTKERGLAVIEQIQSLAKNTSLRTLGMFSGAGMQPELDALADGTDIIVGTPDRVRAIYLKLALNMNKIIMFILDDAELLIKQGFQLPVNEIARSLPKCQRLVFSEVFHEKLEKLIGPYMNYPIQIEVNEMANTIETYELNLYNEPNFRTKINLLNQLLFDEGTFQKLVIFVNSIITAQKIYTSLSQRNGEDVILYRPANFDQEGCDSFEEFKRTEKYRVIVAANEQQITESLYDIPHIIHFELPAEVDLFIQRIEKQSEEIFAPVFITFSTDFELSQVKKIENAIGHKMKVISLPEDLKIETDQKNEKEEQKELLKEKDPTSVTDSAFHQKKESNMKQYNYGYKDKMKMAGKISKRRNK